MSQSSLSTASRLVFLALLTGCSTPDPARGPETALDAAPALCTEVKSIAGSYTCSGHCVANTGKVDAHNNKPVLKVITIADDNPETDTIRAVAGAEGIYEVQIVGPEPEPGEDRFFETEIGTLTGTVLRTATALVSDRTYPVLEEYVFDTDAGCRAIGFTKVVRGTGLAPTPDGASENFKACNILCMK